MRFLGLVIAMGCGAMGATQARAGFTCLPAPAPTTSAAPAPHAGPDFTPRCDAPDLDLSDHNDTSAIDLPDAWDLRPGHSGGDDSLVKSLTGEKSGAKTSYSQFWEDGNRVVVRDQFSDLGVDVKTATPVVVPLPQGVWAGLIGLVLVIYLQVRRHRRQLI